jgi:hypothetical protein
MQMVIRAALLARAWLSTGLLEPPRHAAAAQLASRVYHPNEIWGGYSDYYGFGTDEYLELTRQLGADPLIVLPAPDDMPASVEYAMNWLHYVNDPPATTWGRMRGATDIASRTASATSRSTTSR